MSNRTQTSKNIRLTYSLMDYIINSKNFESFPSEVTFIPFSKNDAELNKENETLLKKLSKQEAPVAIAQEPESPVGKWIITAVNF